MRAQSALAVARLDEQDGRVEQLNLGLGDIGASSRSRDTASAAAVLWNLRARVLSRALRYWISMPARKQLSFVGVNPTTTCPLAFALAVSVSAMALFFAPVFARMS